MSGGQELYKTFGPYARAHPSGLVEVCARGLQAHLEEGEPSWMWVPDDSFSPHLLSLSNPKVKCASLAHSGSSTVLTDG